MDKKKVEKVITVEILSKTDDEEIKVKIGGIDKSLMVAFRRNCIESVDTMAIENLEIKYKSANVMDDQKLAHRLGQIPFTSFDAHKYDYPRHCRNKECRGECPGCAVVYTLDVKNVDEHGGVRNVTSLDLKPDDECTTVIPCGGPDGPPNPPIGQQGSCILYNNKGGREMGKEEEEEEDDDKKIASAATNQEKFTRLMNEKYPDIPESQLKYSSKNVYDTSSTAPVDKQNNNYSSSLLSDSIVDTLSSLSAALADISLSTSTSTSTSSPPVSSSKPWGGMGSWNCRQVPHKGAGVLICCLQPEQELSLRMVVRKGSVKTENHHKYQPCALIGLKYPAILKLNGEKIRKLKLEEKKQLVKESPEIFQYDVKTDIFSTIEDPDDSRLCKHDDKPMERCAEYGQEDAIQIFPKFDYFMITVETNGCLRPEEILLEAMNNYLRTLESILHRLSFAKGATF